MKHAPLKRAVEDDNISEGILNNEIGSPKKEFKHHQQINENTKRARLERKVLKLSQTTESLGKKVTGVELYLKDISTLSRARASKNETAENT